MEAKDTVMSKDQIGLLTSEIPVGDSLAQFNWKCWREIAQAQAEMSFKAGVREGVKLNKAITEHILQDGKGNWSIESWRIKQWFIVWQAQLKEWGIEE